MMAGADPVRGLALRLGALATALLTGCVLIVSLFAFAAFEREARPEIEREAAVLARTIAAPIERALELGVPFDELSGVERFFDGVLAQRDRIDHLALVGADGTLRALRARDRTGAPDGHQLSIALRQDGQAVGALRISLSRAELDGALADARWDIAIVCLVAFLAVFELIRVLVARAVAMPMQAVDSGLRQVLGGEWEARGPRRVLPDEAGAIEAGLAALRRRLADRRERLRWLAAEIATLGAAAGRQAAAALATLDARLKAARPPTSSVMPADATAARWPLFLFVVAEQLSTSFIPLHAARLAGAEAFGGLALALPITVFVAAVALATPYGARLVQRHGARATLLLGLVPAALGHVGAALAPDLVGFALARGVCGAGYAIATIACQVHLAQVAPQGRVARTLGGFTGAVMTGAVCGTAIGAAIADRIGFAGTFLVSALLLAGVALAGARHLDAAGKGGVAQPLLREIGEALRAPGFAALVLLIAVPGKIVLTGVVFTLAPVELAAAGYTQAAIGRVVMLYGLAMLPAILLGAWLMDRFGAGGLLLALAGIGNGVALMLLLGDDGGLGLPLVIVATGVAQGIAAAPMLALAPAIAARSGRVGAGALLGLLRVGERLGSVAGPLLAAAFLAASGAVPALAAIGAVSLLAALLYAAVAGLRR